MKKRSKLFAHKKMHEILETVETVLGRKCLKSLNCIMQKFTLRVLYPWRVSMRR